MAHWLYLLGIPTYASPKRFHFPSFLPFFFFSVLYFPFVAFGESRISFSAPHFCLFALGKLKDVLFSRHLGHPLKKKHIEILERLWKTIIWISEKLKQMIDFFLPIPFKFYEMRNYRVILKENKHHFKVSSSYVLKFMYSNQTSILKLSCVLKNPKGIK